MQEMEFIDNKINHMCKFLHRSIPFEVQNNIFNKLLQIDGYITPPSSPRILKIPNAPKKI
jgi:hypothetical protein